MWIMRRTVVGLVIAILPARSLLTPPTALPVWPSQIESCSARRLWGVQQLLRRRPQSSPTVRYKESSTGCAGNHATAVAASASERGSTWGRTGLSSWLAGATSLSRVTTTPAAGTGACWNRSKYFGGGGGNNGTGGGGGGGGGSCGGAMGDGGSDGDGDGDGGGAEDINLYSSRSRSSCNDGPFEAGFRTPFQGAPWMWLSAIWGLYAAWLRRSPLLAKALTSGVLGIGGDMAAQFFEFRQQQQQQQGGGGGRKAPFVKDVRRVLAVAIDSTLITGPALHGLYGLLELLIPTAAGGFIPAASHVLIDTFVFDPVFVTSFFCVTGMLEGRSLKRDVLPALRREFWPAVRGSWVVSFFFCPLQFVTFRYLPLEFRVLSVNVCDIAWTSVLSYFSHKAPPQKEAARIDDGGAGTRALGRRERTTRQQHSPAKNSRNSGFNRRNASGSSSSGVNGPARDSKHLSEARA